MPRNHHSWPVLQALLLCATFAGPLAWAAPVDLSNWIAADIDPAGGSVGNWTVQSGNDSVIQSVNGQPTIFYDPYVNAQGSKLLGNIVVNTSVR